MFNLDFDKFLGLFTVGAAIFITIGGICLICLGLDFILNS